MFPKAAPREQLHAEPEIAPLSPPAIVAPIYHCAIAVGVKGYSPEAEIEVQVNGDIAARRPAGQPGAQGITIPLPIKLFAGDRVRVRQKCPDAHSDWSPEVTVRHS